jgi:excisionase family DNA binding protein
MENEEYLTVGQVATRLKVDPETVRRMLRDGRLDGVRLGGRKAGWRISASSVTRLLKNGGRA